MNLIRFVQFHCQNISDLSVPVTTVEYVFTIQDKTAAFFFFISISVVSKIKCYKHQIQTLRQNKL